MPREGRRDESKDATTKRAARARVVAAKHTDARRKRVAASAPTQPRTVAIVGAGRVGSALALALAACGYHISALVTNNGAHARHVARLFSTPRPHALAATQLASLPRTDLLLIATPDGQIAKTAAQLAGRLATHRDQARSTTRIALHTSGALSSDVLSELRATGYAVGSLHPLVSVSEAQAGAASLRGAFYCVEGDARAVKVARQIVRALGGRSFSIKPADKALYHAAAVLASGHTVALFALATELLAHCGVARQDARRALLPLTQSTLTNLLNARTPAHALTGPFARGDAATVRRNLAALSTLDDLIALHIYALLGQQALRLAQTKTARAARAEIEAALASVSEQIHD
ncbi:MAG: DUF2520 domain-containing protein [Acidobacteria bacterium]|nr:MAG: DUF2520 domain-containing protein [Acidobacteriota bacterium]